MAKKPVKPAKAPALRRQAEERLRTTKRDVAAMPAKDVQQLVHELQIHQIELEMQNDELRRTQAELEAARDRYAKLYDFSPAGHLTLDVQGNILGANIMAGTLLGLSRNKLSGQPLARFIAGEDQDAFRHHVREVMGGGAQRLCEVRLRRESGVSRCLLLKSLAVPDASGLITSWRTALLDISERKRDEEDLKKLNVELALAKERLDWVMRATHDGVWDWDLVHGTLYYSSRWKEMHGFHQAEVIESVDEWAGRIHSDDRERVLGQLQDYLGGEAT